MFGLFLDIFWGFLSLWVIPTGFLGFVYIYFVVTILSHFWFLFLFIWGYDELVQILGVGIS